MKSIRIEYFVLLLVYSRNSNTFVFYWLGDQYTEIRRDIGLSEDLRGQCQSLTRGKQHSKHRSTLIIHYSVIMPQSQAKVKSFL